MHAQGLATCSDHSVFVLTAAVSSAVVNDVGVTGHASSGVTEPGPNVGTGSATVTAGCQKIQIHNLKRFRLQKINQSQPASHNPIALQRLCWSKPVPLT